MRDCAFFVRAWSSAFVNFYKGNQLAKDLGDVPTVNFINKNCVALVWIFMGLFAEAFKHSGLRLVGNSIRFICHGTNAFDEVLITVRLVKCYELIGIRNFCFCNQFVRRILERRCRRFYNSIFVGTTLIDHFKICISA